MTTFYVHKKMFGKADSHILEDAFPNENDTYSLNIDNFADNERLHDLHERKVLRGKFDLNKSPWDRRMYRILGMAAWVWD